MKWAYYAFVLECIVNLFSTPLMVFAPGIVMAELLGQQPEEMTEETAECVRWFGCMVRASCLVLELIVLFRCGFSRSASGLLPFAFP